MPITINDCRHCGRPPYFGYDDMGDGYADLIFFCCCSPKFENEGRGERLEAAVNKWNENNAVSPDDTDDIGGHPV